jgi:hypothetical protein
MHRRPVHKDLLGGGILREVRAGQPGQLLGKLWLPQVAVHTGPRYEKRFYRLFCNVVVGVWIFK